MSERVDIEGLRALLDEYDTLRPHLSREPEMTCAINIVYRLADAAPSLLAEVDRLRGEVKKLKAKQPSRADVRAAVCDRLETWARALIDNDHPESENVRHVFLLIRKSSLLARLVYGGEQLRTVRCPKHDGRWSGLPCDGNDCACGLTGWIPAALAAQERREGERG